MPTSLPSPDWFVAASARGVLALLLATVAAPATAQVDLGRMLRNSIQNGIAGIGCDKYRKWLAAAPASVGTRNQELLLPLVDDAAFVPAFGKPYRQLTQADLADAQRKLAECQRAQALTPAEQAQASQVLNPYAHQALVRRLDAEQAQRNELTAVKAEVAALPATPEGLAQLDRLAARGEAALRNSRDNAEHLALRQSVDAARARIAGPVETQRVNEAIASASGIQGLQDLAALHDRLGRAGLPNDTAIALREKVATRLAALAPAAVAQERAQVTPPAGDLASLARHTQQLREFDGRTRGMASLVPELGSLRQALVAERQPALPAAWAGVQRQVATALDPAQPADLISRHFLDEELTGAPGVALRGAATERTALLQRIAASVAVFGPQPEHERLLTGQAVAPAAPVAAAAAAPISPTRCDLLAAHPDDPARVAPGVPDDRFDAKAAVPACAEAVKRDPKAGRRVFQLARAQLDSGRPAEAVVTLKRAAELNNAAAHYYLSEAYAGGAQGLAPNAKMAAQMAARAQALGYGSTPAVAAGSTAAARSGAEPKFADADYEDVNMVRAIYFGDVSLLSDGKNYRFNYALAQAEVLTQECRSFKLSELDAIRAARLRSQLPGTTDEMARQGFQNIGNALTVMAQAIQNPRSMADMAERSQRVEMAGAYGGRDIVTLAGATGGCQGAPLKRYAQNLRTYLNR